MKHIVEMLCRTAAWCGVLAVVIATLPLAVLAVIMLRGLLLAAVLAGLVVIAVVTVLSPRFRHRLGHRPHTRILHLL